MTRLQWLLIILAIVIVGALIGIGWKYFNFNQTTPQTSPSIASPSPAKTTTAQPSATTDDWLTYTNNTFNYTVKYPSNVKVKETEFVNFSGPSSEKGWPLFEIYHFDSAFYHPGAGTDVYEYITKEALLTFSETDPSKDIKIGGLPAIHLKNDQSPQADASDHYFFIKGTQLFGIQIIHVGGREDWDLYNKFLDSFTFK